MPRCSVFIATSLDGYIARPDGDLGWLGDVQLAGEDYGYAAFFATIDALVVGRGTWDSVRDFDPWPYAGKRVVVLTKRPAAPVHGEELASGAIAPVLGRLYAEGVRRVYVDGGVVVRQALAEGLVDDLTVSIVPRLLGDGIPLFGPGTGDVRLRSLGSQAWAATGLVQVRYEVVRPGAGSL